MSRVAVVLNTGGADRCDGCSQLVESFRSVVELSNFAKCGQNSNKLKNCKFCEFGEFRQKLKNWEKCINSNVWRSLGAIGIDSVSFEAFRSVSSFFIFFQFLSSGLKGPIGVVSWLRGMHRYGFLAWKR